MKFIGLAALAAACALVTGPLAAADLRGQPSLKDAPFDNTPTYKYYIGIRGGANFPEDTDFNAFGTKFTNAYDPGYFVSGVLGVELARSSSGRLRGDIEIGYDRATIDTQTLAGVGTFSGSSATGRTSTTFGLASLYYDFETGTIFRPFVGAGGGIADVSLRHQGIAPGFVALSSSDTAYAYHLTAGLNTALSASLDLELAYRYFGTTGAELRAKDGTRTDVDTGEHQIMLGLRQKF
jgi:opacity protein-like surface antigen